MPIVPVTLSLDTSQYASGDVLAATQSVSGITKSGRKGVLKSITVIDKDDQGAALDLVFLRSNVSLGTENAAAGLSAANSVEVLAVVPIASGDYVDLGSAKVATKTGLDIELTPTTGTAVFVGAISRGTGTYTAAGIQLRLNIQHQ